jgi:hypothetical protein
MIPLRILDILLGVNLTDDESVCDAHKAIWHAQLDLLREFDMSEDNRDFDNYDICDPNLVPSFVAKVKRLLEWCGQQGVTIAPYRLGKNYT